MNAFVLGGNALGIASLAILLSNTSARHYLWSWLTHPDWAVKGLGLFVVLCALTPFITLWWLWQRGGNQQEEDFFAPPQYWDDNSFTDVSYEQESSNLLRIGLVGVLALALLGFAVTRHQASQSLASGLPFGIGQGQASQTTTNPGSSTDPPGCDPTLVWEIYDQGWAPSQGTHMGMAVDIVAKNDGDPLYSPICGWVRYNGMGGQDDKNTKFVVDNSVYSVQMYHGAYDPSLVPGSAISLGQAIGRESNIGWTYDDKENFCGTGSSCGYHTHISVWDARVGAEVDISTIWLPRGVLFVPTPHPFPATPVPPQVIPDTITGFDPNVTRWAEPLIRWASHYGVNLRDAATIMTIESGGREGAESKSGAIGLMQIMAEYHSGRLQPGESLWTPEVNIRVGLEIFSEHMSHWPGQPAAWYAAYNGGGKAGDWFAGLVSREQYVTYLNGLGYNGEAKAVQVETYVSRAMALR